MLLKKLSTTDLLIMEKDLIKIEFRSKRNVLSTCSYNGGYQEDLETVFNYDSSQNNTVMSEMKAPTIKEHMRLIAEEIGLLPESCAGMCTSAQMKNVSIQQLEHQDLIVTAIVTGGIDVNGGRVGDLASWYEHEEKFESINLVSGTINIMLVLDANVSEDVLASALMTATEAKVAAIQELLLPSKYSSGIATGSGTDKIIIIANPASSIKLTDAGKHSKLGELIGKTVILAVKEALEKQTKVTPQTQHSVIKRMERYGITEERIHLKLKNEKEYNNFDYIHWQQLIQKVDKKSEIVILASLYTHLLDQLEWGLLNENEVFEASDWILDRENWLNYDTNYINTKKNKTDPVEYLVLKFLDKLVSYIYFEHLNNV